MENSELILARADQLERTARELKQVASERKWLRRGAAVGGAIIVVLLTSNVILNIQSNHVAHRVYGCTVPTTSPARDCPADAESSSVIEDFTDTTKQISAAAAWCALYGPHPDGQPTYEDTLACTRERVPVPTPTPSAPTPTPSGGASSTPTP